MRRFGFAEQKSRRDVPPLTLIVTDLEFCLRCARALLPTRPEEAAHFVERAVTMTVDPRLRNLTTPVLSMIERNDLDPARHWLDRALEYERLAARPPLMISKCAVPEG